MAEADDKKRPMAERIAGQYVKSSFRDIRDGIGGGRTFGAITDQDIAAALGLVKLAAGKLPVWALETYYGSSLVHEHRLRAAWAELELESDTVVDRIRDRVAGALAIRDFAGAVNPPSLYVDWGQLVLMPPDQLRRRVNAALSWLEGHRSNGIDKFRLAMADVQAEKERKRA